MCHDLCPHIQAENGEEKIMEMLSNENKVLFSTLKEVVKDSTSPTVKIWIWGFLLPQIIIDAFYMYRGDFVIKL